MFRNIYFKLGLISAITTTSLLIVLPRTPVKINNALLKLDTEIGGYVIDALFGRVHLDLTDFKKGLDVKGGIKVVLKADTSKVADADKDHALEAAKEIISRRVNLLGVTEPNITTVKTSEDTKIIVEIPGIENTAQAVDLIGQTAQLHYKQLKPEIIWDETKYFEYIQDPNSWEDTGITGADMRGADVVINQGQDLKTAGRPQIQLKFTPEGRNKFSEVAKKNVGKPIALYLDQSALPLSAPLVDKDLVNGLVTDPVINGNFDFKAANNLSIQIRAGALPIPVSILQQQTIGATLGDEAIQKSLFAGTVGLLLVLIFLIFKYGKLGVVSSVALIIYSLIVLAIFKIIPVVLTLPGIAGFILSIGMATDANILIFERVKEELFWGKPRNLAIKLGFDRAWNSIRDSNISSLITSYILFQFGSGPIRGFALTLAIGIAVSLFTSIYVVRTFIEAFNLGGTGAHNHD